LAQVLAARGEPAGAARLLGAAQTLGEGIGGAIGGVTYAHLAETIRARLGAARFAAIWAEGRALTLAQAVALTAVRSCAPGGPVPPPTRSAAALLTPREREVAALLERGYPDRQIADVLCMSVSTVGVHVHHILQKLQLQSRWQVADRLAMQELLPRDPD
jgi:DNA-binding NarL/FixJ family response regulator